MLMPSVQRWAEIVAAGDSPRIFFSMYINDIDTFQGVNMGKTVFLLLCADENKIISENEQYLQLELDIVKKVL